MDQKVPVYRLQSSTYSQTEESLEGILGTVDSYIGQPGRENKERSVVIWHQTPKAAVLVERID